VSKRFSGEEAVKRIEAANFQPLEAYPGFVEEIRMVELLDISKMCDSQIDSYAKQIWEKLANPKMGGT
jgi:hypothetical protein